MKNLILIGIVAAGSVFSIPVFTVIPTLGPDFGLGTPSPNFAPWAANVVTGIINNTTPGSGVQTYVPLPTGATLTGAEFISTPFQSWQGVTPGPFPSEQGTALYFSLKVVESKGTFTLNDLAAQETYLGQVQLPYVAGDFGGALPFNSYLRGRKFSDGQLTNGSEAGGIALTELYYVGVGFVQGLDPLATGSNQDKINATVAQVQALANRTTQVSYSIGNASGSSFVNVSGTIPEPGTWALMGAGLAGLAFLRRRK